MKKNDCDIIIDSLEDTFSDLGDCFESVFDSKNSKRGVFGSLFSFTKSLTKLTFNTTSCAIKQTPKVIVAVADVKRELINGIEKEINEFQKEQKENALNDKIKQLKLKKRT